jgi:MurNAc alpha-1-phosphate uridylyltransferase
MSHSLSVLILAAGLGTRLKPYTDKVPKPLTPVVDRNILEHQMDAIHSMARICPVAHVGANAHHLAEQIQSASAILGIEHVFVEMPNILGTGGPLHRLRAHGWHGEVLVLNGDNYHDFDLAAFVKAARASHDPFALLCMDFGPANNLECDVHGRICGRDGKYSVGSSVRKVAFSGVSWYAPETVSRIAGSDFNVVDFWKREAEAGRLPLAYLDQREHTWIDMGSPEGLYRACEARLLQLHVDRWVHPTVKVEGVQIGSGSIVSEGVQIGKEAQLERSLLLPGAVVDPGQVVKNCILGAGFQWNI